MYIATLQLIRFSVYFNIREESSPGYAEEESGEGTTFQRLISSELVKIHCDRE